MVLYNAGVPIGKLSYSERSVSSLGCWFHISEVVSLGRLQRECEFQSTIEFFTMLLD